MSGLQTNASLVGLFVPGNIRAGSVSSANIITSNIVASNELLNGVLTLSNGSIAAPNTGTLQVDVGGNLLFSCPTGQQRLKLQDNGDCVFYGNQLFLENSDSQLVGSGASGANPSYSIFRDSGDNDAFKLRTTDSTAVSAILLRGGADGAELGRLAFPEGVVEVIDGGLSAGVPQLNINDTLGSTGDGLSLKYTTATSSGELQYVVGGVPTTALTLTSTGPFLSYQILPAALTGNDIVCAAASITPLSATTFKAVAGATYRITIPARSYDFPTGLLTDAVDIQIRDVALATTNVMSVGATTAGEIGNFSGFTMLVVAPTTDAYTVIVDNPAAATAFTFSDASIGGKLIVERVA